MREIKFRAWWKEAKLMADVEVWREDDIVIIVPVVSSIPGHKFERQLLDEGEYNLMQYTGLKDKNGKEIYEGDIIKGNDTDQGNCIVKYIEAQFDLYSINGEDLYSDYFLKTGDIQERELEIIGNIYETPELLN